MQQKIIPNLWFDTEAEEAAGFYILGGGVLPDHLRDPGRGRLLLEPAVRAADGAPVT